MKAKKIFIALILFGLTMHVFGQGVGVFATYNIAKQRVVIEGDVQPGNDFTFYKPLSSLGFELNYDLELSDNLYGEFGLSYVQKGLKITVENEGYNPGDDLFETYKISYLQIPLHIRYNFEAGDNIYFFGFGGLDLGMAIGGKYLRDDGNKKSEEALKFGSAARNNYKSGDMGFTIGGGLLFHNFELRVGYNMGLSNIATTSDEQVSNRVFFAGLGYRFDL